MDKPSTSKSKLKCRSCLNKTFEIKSFTDEIGVKRKGFDRTITVLELINYCTDIDANYADGLPQQICLVCLESLLKYYNLLQQCQRSQLTLKADLSGRIEETVEDEKSKNLESIVHYLPPSVVKIKSNPTTTTHNDIENKREQDLKASKAENNKQLTKKRVHVDFSHSSLERNFITPVRAMSDFLLKPSDLESLAPTKRRSPYKQEPPITVYWRKHVEAKAIQIWGSRENFLKECLKREIEKKKQQQNMFTVKRRLREYRRKIGFTTPQSGNESGFSGDSGRVVLIAIAINLTNCLVKLGAWIYTGSHSMFAEAIHSAADTTNQLILAYGIHKSTQQANPNHPYGYLNMKYVSSLISGVAIFCVGAGLSFYHGTMGLLSPQPVDDFFWGFVILAASLVSESVTLIIAISSIRRGARAMNMTFLEYVVRGHDPCVNVLLTEDGAAILSVGLAAFCMGLSILTDSSIPDAIGSLLVSCVLGLVASFIIHTNVAALVGRSIRQEIIQKINAELENDIMIRAIHDVKGIDMGNSLVRYKAEMDFDGRELTRAYLDKQDLNALLDEMKTFQSIDDVESYMLKHGENIVDLVGGEIDRIEMKLRSPYLQFCIRFPDGSKDYVGQVAKMGQ